MSIRPGGDVPKLSLISVTIDSANQARNSSTLPGASRRMRSIPLVSSLTSKSLIILSLLSPSLCLGRAGVGSSPPYVACLCARGGPGWGSSCPRHLRLGKRAICQPVLQIDHVEDAPVLLVDHPIVHEEIRPRRADDRRAVEQHLLASDLLRRRASLLACRDDPVRYPGRHHHPIVNRLAHCPPAAALPLDPAGVCQHRIDVPPHNRNRPVAESWHHLVFLFPSLCLGRAGVGFNTDKTASYVSSVAAGYAGASVCKLSGRQPYWPPLLLTIPSPNSVFFSASSRCQFSALRRQSIFSQSAVMSGSLASLAIAYLIRLMTAAATLPSSSSRNSISSSEASAVASSVSPR